MFLRLVYLLILLLSFFSVQAQKNTFHIGGALSLTSPWILNQNNYGTLDGFNNDYARRSELDYKFGIGGNFGIVAGYNVTKRSGIQFSLFFDQAGQKYLDNISQETNNGRSTFPVEVQRNIKLNYLRLPIMYKFELQPKSRSVRKTAIYYCAFGPQFSYLVSVYESVKIADPSIGNNLAAIPESDKFRKLDMGLAINNGVQLYVRNDLYFNVGINLYVGLVDINGKTIRNLEYFSKNDVEYRPSYSFNAGLNAGVHYLFIKREFY